MKSYSIGREPSCSIVINDPQKIISRNHAILTVADNGKITIVDQSTNGTYINGIRISSNVPVPVTRKDKISFAHVANLDWNRIPKEGGSLKYVLWGVGGVVAAGLIVWLIITLVGNKSCNNTPIPVDPIIELTDSIDSDKKADKDRQKEIADSLKHVTDSLQRALENKKPKTEAKKEKDKNNNTGKTKPESKPKTDSVPTMPDI